MAPIGVFVNVFEVRILRIVVEVKIGIGIGGPLPSIGNVQILGVDHLRLFQLAAMSFFGRCWNRHGPVVAIIAHRADDLLLGNDLHHPRQVPHKPVLAGNWPRLTGCLVLVVVHQNNAVGIGRNLLQVRV